MTTLVVSYITTSSKTEIGIKASRSYLEIIFKTKMACKQSMMLHLDEIAAHFYAQSCIKITRKTASLFEDDSDLCGCRPFVV